MRPSCKVVFAEKSTCGLVNSARDPLKKGTRWETRKTRFLNSTLNNYY